MTATYDYAFLELQRGLPARRAFIDHLTASKAALAAVGGEVLGLFTTQIGWEAAQVALLLRWQGARDPAVRLNLLSATQVIRSSTETLAATLRPADEATLPAGGIYVHRWFETLATDLEEFQRLSGEGWKDFEPRFDARVFGLLLADQSVSDLEFKSRRLLLITRYGDHGVWEASRDPSTEAMQTFGRRALLTRRTYAASTLLTAI